MEFNDNIKEELLKGGRGPRRLFWWNVALVAVGLALVGVIIAGVFSRKCARQEPPEPDNSDISLNQPITNTEAVVQSPEASWPPGAEVQPEPAVLTTQSQAVLEQARKMRATGNLLQAREKCYELLVPTSDIQVIRAAEDLLGAMNIELVFTPAAMPEKSDYVVQAGDSLVKIARKFGTTIDLIRKGNQLRGDVIRVGDRMRVFGASMTVRVSKQKNDLTVMANERFFKRYRVGTGKYGSTPLGVFAITDKITEPPWWRPDGKVIPFGDKENLLGTRWMSLKPIEDTDPVRGYGIHGTWEPETIGHQSSDGCVRMFNEEVEELYMLLPVGTRVVIEE